MNDGSYKKIGKPFFDIVDPERDTPELILSVLTSEIGDMHKCLNRARRYPDLARAYEAELRIATADAYTMLSGFIKLKNWKVMDIENLGRKRVLSRLQDMSENGVY